MLHYLAKMEFGPKEIMRIMEVTDGLSLHREAVRIPLWNQGAGSVQLVSGGTVVEITAPGEGDFEVWLGELPTKISKLDLSSIARNG